MPPSLDPLTGAQTRAVFQRRLAAELKRAQRANTPLALVLIDLDHVKSINDAFGHSRGDQVLATFAQRVTAVFRSGDQLFRFGGNEFVLLLPNTDRPRALAAAERLLEALSAAPFAGEPPLSLTLSIRLAALPEDGPQCGIANSLLNLSEAAYDQGALAEALALCGESLLLRRELGDQPGLALCLEGAARAWAAQGRPQVAAVLLGDAERLRETLGVPVPPSAQRIYQQALAAAQAALGDTAFAATRAGGRSLSLAQLAEQARLEPKRV